MRHVDAYDVAGVDLSTLPLVGVGSVCRRQGMAVAVAIVRAMTQACVLNVHGFGFKLTGLRRVGAQLASSDSMAWSFRARRDTVMEGHTHKTCSNCLPYALRWRERVIGILGGAHA